MASLIDPNPGRSCISIIFFRLFDWIVCALNNLFFIILSNFATSWYFSIIKWLEYVSVSVVYEVSSHF